MKLSDPGQLLFQSYTNNEMGLVHPISDIADIVHAHGALLHVDCAQAVGTCSFDVAAMGADLASFSAHKCHGPKGVGAALCSASTTNWRLIHRFWRWPGTWSSQRNAKCARYRRHGASLRTCS